MNNIKPTYFNGMNKRTGKSLSIIHYPLSILALALILSSCQFRKPEYVDFEKYKVAAGADCFQPYSINNSSVETELSSNSYMPGGMTVREYSDGVAAGTISELGTAEGELRTTSTSMGTVLQNLIDYYNGNDVIQVVGTYKSTDENNKPITLSGKIVMPIKGQIKRYILVSHYTIGSNAEAPSNCFPLEAVLASKGYAMIFPDYLGYGVTSNRIHPYLSLKLTATNVLDMYKAVKPYMEAIGRKPLHDDIYLMGYSQGGAATIAVQYAIEKLNYIPDKIKRVFVGGGPYDIVATYDSYVTGGEVSYPCAVPLVIQGMNQSDKLGMDIKKLLTAHVADNMDNWFNSKKYTTVEINKLIGTKDVNEILSAIGQDRTSSYVAVLYKAMKNNSVLGIKFNPMAPVYMVHSMDDETVPYINAQNAKNKWESSNIKYNFGHYGSHVNTALRFIYSVSTLLKEEEN